MVTAFSLYRKDRVVLTYENYYCKATNSPQADSLCFSVSEYAKDELGAMRHLQKSIIRSCRRPV